jgi:hypothetical protein
MKRAIVFLGLALVAVGCGGSKDGQPTADSTPAGKPAPDEAKACIVAYLNQCGWKDVELAQIADQPQVPTEAKATGEAWAFAFTAHYTNVFGERQTSANWVAVVTRADGKPCVKSCFDESRKLVGGHTGAETNEKGNLVRLAPAEDLPPIVAPRP